MSLLRRVLGRLAQCIEGLTTELRVGFVALLDEAGDLCLHSLYLMRCHETVVFRLGQLSLGVEPGDLRGYTGFREFPDVVE